MFLMSPPASANPQVKRSGVDCVAGVGAIFPYWRIVRTSCQAVGVSFPVIREDCAIDLNHPICFFDLSFAQLAARRTRYCFLKPRFGCVQLTGDSSSGGSNQIFGVY